MVNFLKFLSEVAASAEAEMVSVAEKNDEIRDLYELKLKAIFDRISFGKLQPPSDELQGYWYYFSPEGPWNIWETEPQLVKKMSRLINLMGLANEEEFEAYCKQCGIS